MEFNKESLTEMYDTHIYDVNGDKIGSVDNIYTDDTTGEPEWITVHTGFFGTHEVFIPLTKVSKTEDGHFSVQFDKEFVKNAPHLDVKGDLSQKDEDRLYAYYGQDSNVAHDTNSSYVGEREANDAAAKSRFSRNNRTNNVDSLAKDNGSGSTAVK